MIWFLLGCTDGPVVPEPEPLDCTLPIAVDWSVHEGFQGGEDLALVDGEVVSVDREGRLTRRSFAGEQTLIASGLGEIAGLVALPDGSFVLADVLAGALIQVGSDGSVRTVVSGLAYPNGLALAGPDAVVVSEQSDGRLSRVEVSSGTRTVLAEGLDRPNGVVVDTDGSVLVTSFGSGTITRVGAQTRSFGDVLIPVPSTPCETEGEACLTGEALGTCQSGTCEALAATCPTDGEPCSSEVLGQTVHSRCQDGLCPLTPTGQLDACVDQLPGASCSLEGQTGICAESVQGLVACDLGPTDDCTVAGASCTANDGLRPFFGTCLDFAGVLACRPPELDVVGGGLDGLEVDACGHVWATEFRTGALHHWGPEGGRSEVVAELPSGWIPNLVWSEAGHRLFVMERGDGRLFDVRVR